MKLLPTHFVDIEPESKKDDRILGSIERFQDHKKAHTEWTKRQVKPKDDRIEKWASSIGAEYKTANDDYHKALTYYNENKLRYRGFEQLVKSSPLNFHARELDDSWVTFYADKKQVQMQTRNTGVLTFWMGMSTELFELIMKENNIELEIL